MMEIDDNGMKIRPVCEHCGSSNVCHDAWAVWDNDKQEWVLGNVFDYTFCQECESETHLKEIQINP